MSRCRSCNAPLEWGVTDNGRRIPLDLGLWPDGRLVVVGRRNGSALVVSLSLDQMTRLRSSAGAELQLRRSHFQTCPNADEHRRR